LVRASLFETLGGFDERFFMYYEEVDFSLRALIHGYTSCILFEAVAYHTGNVSSNRIKDRRLFYLLRSRLRYTRKHFSIGGHLVVGIFAFLLEPWVRCLHGVLTKSTEAITTTIRGYRYLVEDILLRH